MTEAWSDLDFALLDVVESRIALGALGQPLPAVANTPVGSDELVVLPACEALLVEKQGAGTGHWEGRSQGVGLRIARGVTYRVGTSHGRLVQGPEQIAQVDTGRWFVTTRRVVFLGTKTTREWHYSKLLGVDPISDDVVLLHVSNRPKPSGIATSAMTRQYIEAGQIASSAGFRDAHDYLSREAALLGIALPEI